MLKRLSLIRLLPLAALLLIVAPLAAHDAPAEPAAVRVRVAHLAPFPGSDTANVDFHVAGNVVRANMAYGDRSDYQVLAGGPGDYLVEVLRDGEPVVSETLSLPDGDTSLIFTGDVTQVPLNVLTLNENLPDPGPGAGGLRVVHVAAIGSTIDTTRVDVCDHDGDLFHSSANGLRYLRSTAFRLLPVGSYDLRVSRTVSGGDPCAGPLLIDPPAINLTEGAERSLFLVGDGANQPLGAFTFGDGLIGDDGPPPSGKLYLPTIRKQ